MAKETDPGVENIPEAVDVVVLGSGAAALAGALTVSVAGLSALILEKTEWIGGTSAMSGGMTWAPANPVAAAAGLADTPEEALAYIRAAGPPGWQTTEDRLWEAQARNAGAMISFLQQHSAVRFTIADVPDPMMELPGAKKLGRLLTPAAISKRILGPYARRIRR
jgi:3-oxosteroid 1-dehydrogenase